MPDANRTRNPQLRRLVLYPVELRAHANFYYTFQRTPLGCLPRRLSTGGYLNLDTRCIEIWVDPVSPVSRDSQFTYHSLRSWRELEATGTAYQKNRLKAALKHQKSALVSKYTQELNAKQDRFDRAGISMLSCFNRFAYCLSHIVNTMDFLYIYTSNHDAETRTRLISSQKE